MGGQQWQTESRAISEHGLDTGHIPGIDEELNTVSYLRQTAIKSATSLTCLAWLWSGREYKCKHTLRKEI